MRLCQLEFFSYDVEASLQFTGAVLGWTRVPVAIQDQSVIAVASDSPYGISIRKRSKKANPGQPGQPPLLAYFEVDQKLAVLREQCLALGALIVQEPMIVTGYGVVMIVEDRGGLRFGLYEARFVGPRHAVPF